jgi:2-succinyl-5-enolpyruvyl-6-hydroxy-3-cyclohexene-1-carboxylate synthase
MFREPLSDADSSTPHSHPTKSAHHPTDGDGRTSPYGPLVGAPLLATAGHPWKVPSGRALVIAGGMGLAEAHAAKRLAERLNCPFLADVTTGLRGLSYDLQLMRDDNPPPDVVIHCGGRIVSKRWWQFLDRNPPRHYIHLTQHAARLDPLRRVTDVVRGPLCQLCDGATGKSVSPEDFWLDWTRGSETARRAARTVIDAVRAITEPGIACTVSERIPDGTGLHLGNSLPVRDMDSFGWWPSDRTVHVSANRGASGIDGSIATAAGFAAGRAGLTTAVIGDLAALHDLNSLHLLARSPSPVILIVVNNDGGGIFHFLPVAEQTPAFERYFATPHGRTLVDAARMFDLPYHQPVSRDEFALVYQQAIERRRSEIIEVRTDRGANRRFHQEIESAVRSASA